MKFKTRDIESATFLGSRVDFVAANDRIRERVSNLSHERDVLETLVDVTRPSDVVWDVGACLGIHSFILANHLQDGQVIGFEPMPTNRSVYIDNKSVNQLDNVWVEKRALSDETGEAEFAIRESIHAGHGRHSLDTGDYDKLHTITVETARADDLVASGDLPVPNVVKIDVEGAEPLVLEGMAETLSRDACQHVVLETHEPNPVQPSYEDYGYSYDDLIDMLESYGFTTGTLDEPFHVYGTKTSPDSPTVTDAELDIELTCGDIADQSTDAIVNSAGTSLRMGTGVAGALREAGGEELHEAALLSGPVDPGEAVVTDAFDLDADYVIHAASMPHFGSGQSSPQTIRSAVQESLALADDEGCTSVAVPAVGCGLGGVPLVTGADVILTELQEFNPKTLETARFVVYTDDEYDTLASIFGFEES